MALVSSDFQNLIWMAQVKFGISSLDGLLEAGYIQRGENTPSSLKPMTFYFVFATNYISEFSSF